MMHPPPRKPSVIPSTKPRRRINAAGRFLIQDFEKCLLRAYWDGMGRVWTVGWGETGPGIGPDTVWTQEYADHRFELALIQREKAVEAMVRVPITDNQFAALVSFSYNAGTGKNGLAGSTLLRLLNEGKPPAIVAEQFGKWVYSGGQVRNGLIRRRAAERDLFLAPDAS